MEVVDESCYKELEDLEMFYTNMTALKLLDHFTEFCLGLHTVDAVDIPQVKKTLFRDAKGIPQFINAMEAAQRKYKRAKLVIHDEYMHAMALKSLLQSGEYAMETWEWSKLPEEKQTWSEWKRLSRRLTLRSDAQRLPGKGKKNPLMVLLYLERHLKNPTGNYRGKNTKRQRGLPRSQIK